MSERTRLRILKSLKMAGPLTAPVLAERLGVTAVAVRQHLDALLADGLLKFEDEKKGVGRPKRVWALSEDGHAQFPDNHSGLVQGLLNGLRELYGEEGVERLIEHRQETARTAYGEALASAGSLSERLSILADLRSREGYMARVEKAGADYLLIENHCSICAAATACSGFCRSEMALFQDLLGKDVSLTREEHLLSGGRRCVYRVKAVA
jgi:predicted ArsR family transcriptional regulator